MKKKKFFYKFLSFSLIFKDVLHDPKNLFFFFGKKINLGLYFLNSEFIKISLKTCFYYYYLIVKMKLPFIFIGKIENSLLINFFEFFCMKNKLIFFNLNKENNFRKYRIYLKTKNLIIISLFLDTKFLLDLKKDTKKFNIPLIVFSTLSFSKIDFLNSFLGSINYDYIQFLIVLTLVNIYEKN